MDGDTGSELQELRRLEGLVAGGLKLCSVGMGERETEKNTG